jgi:hypothetical protein
MTTEQLTFTPEQKIKWIILKRAKEQNYTQYTEVITPGNIDDLYYAARDALYDVKNEIREGDFYTDLPCEFSRHYESKAVAHQAPDGTYVGWTYWYGGGKHSEPEAMEWMDKAYNVDCLEEEKLVLVRTFTVKE